MLVGFVQGYEELNLGISKLNPLCNGPIVGMAHKDYDSTMSVKQDSILIKSRFEYPFSSLGHFIFIFTMVSRCKTSVTLIILRQNKSEKSKRYIVLSQVA